ncbi:uncharacterized protein LOC129565790 [Sitodiplosis mosellana]|uniref:uncharacterized protein LOC129565790 n=1 Tax=Sitodiplosis mosellana TaxID=263140 RepID=UPI002444F83A|nr:uncharacterized protein LOC129565790 [Sitodiplosis mosellana]XP_055296989.1 uncharacterized protein LOC129565790 [Sitodiplosis mosellana]
MANANKEPTVSYVKFQFDVPKVSALDKCFSPEFVVRGTPWKVGIYKSRYSSENWLAVSLICANTHNSPDWSHIAYASIELLSFGGKQNARKMYTSPFVFNHNETEWDRWLLKWSDLLDVAKQYVSNDTISVKIEIIVADPNDANKSQLVFEDIGASGAERRSMKCQLTITNADSLLAVRSPQITFQNAPWFLVVFKDHKNEYGIRLECRNLEHPEFTADVKMSVKLLAGIGGKSIEQTKTKKFKFNQNLAIKSFASQVDVFNRQKGLNKGKAIVIEVVLEPNQSLCGVDTNANNVPTQRFELECAICLQRFQGQDVSFTPCGHLFCEECIKNTVKLRKTCPVCRTRVTMNQVKRAHLPYSN